MQDKAKIDKELKDWIGKRTNEVISESNKRGLIEGIMVETKPAWVLPMQILIGKIRGQGQPDFYWFICGDLPTDFVQSNVATTPRDVARHFSLKWQVDAERSDNAEHMIHRAEALYGLVEEPRLWQNA